MILRLVVLTAVVLAAMALAAPTLVMAAPAASARAVHCRAAAGDSLPSADFEGRMKAVRGTHRMAMRFEVQERIGTTPWTRVEASPLRHWRRSSPGVASFSFVQRVENLRLEGAYRVVVAFRWRDRSGQVIRVARDASDPCRAAEPVPGT
jgi:hypothetical protein